MMPLGIAEREEEHTIIKIGGGEKTKNHLENLGFVQGSKVSVVNELSGNLIVNVKDTRIALDKQLAMKIMV